MKENQFSVFGVLEANFFLQNAEEDIQIKGYSMFWDKGRENLRRQNARCVLFVRNDLSFKIRRDLMEDSVPEIWMELGLPKKKKSLLCLFYREFSQWGQRTLTDSIHSQTQRFESWTSKVGRILESGRETWLIGDFNFDLSRKDDNSYTRKNIAKMAHQEIIGRGMLQIIKGPTHRFQGRESTIDLIFTNEPRKVAEFGQIATGTEHDCVWMRRESNFITRK